MSKFKVGDLALTLVYDSLLPAGSVVELERALQKGDEITQGFRAPSSGWVVRHAEVSKGTLAYGDHELMPLRGDFQSEQQKAKEVEA
ncbi:TPA: hypothetical protein ACRMX2_004704 [Pseudomonas aeruginosa]|uniref:hypothetical protein n=1 Tax=Pseudomonas aeruginosa TaxID=287 RepID=UPI00071C1359|nr:hypothetical protein [Pseudomonas aeruginosa]KSG12407.1 hypothetical protein AO943_20315 [Pseudomonas aeruginosa]KXD71091.1 hypothetical protein AW910_14205 [Pseudomonas aeruginosa]MCS8090272.1 hypothetical protein [Pseudomonas aeruginosa]MCS8692713.1 hypothetical protein [Pseudomonas aeruginosa]MCS8698754.1 hypothetical protein [Pseudomonas aeruginosa]